MKVAQLLNEGKDDGAQFGFESDKNAKVVAKALKAASIKFSRIENFGISYFDFDTKKDARAAIKIAKSVIDPYFESEWGAPDLQDSIKKITKFLTSARHSKVADVQVDGDYTDIAIYAEFPEHFHTAADVRAELAKGTAFSKVSIQKSDRDNEVRVYTFTLKRVLDDKTADTVQKDLQSLVDSMFKSQVSEAAKSIDVKTPWNKLNKEAKEKFGEFGFATLDEDDAATLIDMKRANELAKKEHGEFGFMTLDEKEMQALVNENPDLIKSIGKKNK